MSSIEVWNSMGYAARVILVVLVAFAALLFFIVVDRFIAYRRAERPAEKAPSSGRVHLQRYMHTLAAIKVTAPMVGLLGTLLGLISATDIFTAVEEAGWIDGMQDLKESTASDALDQRKSHHG